MSNTNNYCLEFLLTTYDITIVNETVQFTHIILQILIFYKEIMKFRFKILLRCHGNEDFNLKVYIFTVLKVKYKGILFYEILMDCVARKIMQKTTSNYFKWFPRYCDLNFYMLSH